MRHERGTVWGTHDRTHLAVGREEAPLRRGRVKLPHVSVHGAPRNTGDAAKDEEEAGVHSGRRVVCPALRAPLFGVRALKVPLRHGRARQQPHVAVHAAVDGAARAVAKAAAAGGAAEQ